jgi:DUF1016 N-terminal domain
MLYPASDLTPSHIICGVYSALTRMVRFAELFTDEKIVVLLLQHLGWAHFLALMPIKASLAREFYAEM